MANPDFFELEVKRRMGYRKTEERGKGCKSCSHSRETTRIMTCDLMQYEVDPKDICDIFKEKK